MGDTLIEEFIHSIQLNFMCKFTWHQNKQSSWLHLVIGSVAGIIMNKRHTVSTFDIIFLVVRECYVKWCSHVWLWCCMLWNEPSHFLFLYKRSRKHYFTYHNWHNKELDIIMKTKITSLLQSNWIFFSLRCYSCFT